MDLLNKKKRELRGFLPSLGIIDTISSLKEFLIEDSERSKTLILVESQIKEARRKQSRGIIDYEKVTIEENKCRNSLLDLIDDINWEDTVLSIFVDIRDGQKYKTASFLGQIWMIENFNFDIKGQSSFYNDDSRNIKYGRLYTLKGAIEACPLGWRLPSDKEWMELAQKYGEFLNDGGGSTATLVATAALFGGSSFLFGLAKSVSGPNKLEQAFDALIEKGSSGFNAKLGGEYTKEGQFQDLGKKGTYWGSVQRNSHWGFSFSQILDNKMRITYCNDELNEVSKVSCRYVKVR